MYFLVWVYITCNPNFLVTLHMANILFFYNEFRNSAEVIVNLSTKVTVNYSSRIMM